MIKRSRLTPEEHQRYYEWFRGDEEAVSFVETLHSITHVWDDLVDRDKPAMSEGTINGAFYDAMVGILRNGFYVEHFDELNFLIEQGIKDWFIANQAERAGNYALSFTMRGSIIRVFAHCAYLIGGEEWGQLVAEEMYQLAFDDFTDYVKEHTGKDLWAGTAAAAAKR